VFALKLLYRSELYKKIADLPTITIQL